MARFVAITNCGFPEAYHCDTALALCAHFADHVGLTWAGGAALGEGGMITGTPLPALGGRTRMTRRALDMAAAALATGQAIPRTAVDLLAKPSIPAWLYLLVAGLNWRQQAKHYSNPKLVMKRSRAFRRPYPAKALTPHNNPKRIAISSPEAAAAGTLSGGLVAILFK